MRYADLLIANLFFDQNTYGLTANKAARHFSDLSPTIAAEVYHSHLYPSTFPNLIFALDV